MQKFSLIQTSFPTTDRKIQLSLSDHSSDLTQQMGHEGSGENESTQWLQRIRFG